MSLCEFTAFGIPSRWRLWLGVFEGYNSYCFWFLPKSSSLYISLTLSTHYTSSGSGISNGHRKRRPWETQVLLYCLGTYISFDYIGDRNANTLTTSKRTSKAWSSEWHTNAFKAKFLHLQIWFWEKCYKGIWCFGKKSPCCLEIAKGILSSIYPKHLTV